jgi:hypothetical protein
MTMMRRASDFLPCYLYLSLPVSISSVRFMTFPALLDFRFRDDPGDPAARLLNKPLDRHRIFISRRVCLRYYREVFRNIDCLTVGETLWSTRWRDGPFGGLEESHLLGSSLLGWPRGYNKHAFIRTCTSYSFSQSSHLNSDCCLGSLSRAFYWLELLRGRLVCLSRLHPAGRCSSNSFPFGPNVSSNLVPLEPLRH